MRTEGNNNYYPRCACAAMCVCVCVCVCESVLNKRRLRYDTRTYIRSRVIPQSSFYASFLISTHARQCPDVRVYLPVHTDVCVCLIDEEAHRVFGSRRRGRGATVEATCRKAPGENAALRTPPSRGRRYCRDNELGTARE